MNKNDKVLVVFNSAGPAALDHDFTEDFKQKDWETEADIIAALKALDIPFDVLGVFDDTEILSQKIRQYRPFFIFNLVERFRGRSELDRDVASLFQLMDLPFTGCGPTGLTLCKNKALSKEILSFHRIRTPQFVRLPRKKPIRRPRRLKFPIFVKPLKEEASMGIAQASFVENDDQFTERVRFIHDQMDQCAIAEEYIEGRELYVSLLGNKKLQVFPVREIKFMQVPEDEPKFASYKAKWDEAYRERWGIRNQFAGPLPNGTWPKIQKFCKKIYRLLSIRGYARLDLRLTPEGEIVFLEANPNPILSKEEDFAESAMKAGLTYPGLIEQIMNLGKQPED